VLRRQAERDSGAEELRIVREEAARWESRVNELLLKYGSVDLAEHIRVADALKVRRPHGRAGAICLRVGHM
jgi:hypothetical protein